MARQEWRISLDKELENAFSDACSEALKTCVSDALESNLKALGLAAFKNVLSQAGGTLTGALATALFKRVLNVSDTIAGDIKKLVREPFCTGAREAGRLLAMTCDDSQERDFIALLLTTCIANLDTAYTLASGSKTARRDRFYIRLIQGLCAAQSPGSRPYLKSNFAECIEIIEQDIQEFSRVHGDLDSKIARNREEKTLLDKERNDFGKRTYSYPRLLYNPDFPPLTPEERREDDDARLKVESKRLGEMLIKLKGLQSRQMDMLKLQYTLVQLSKTKT